MRRAFAILIVLLVPALAGAAVTDVEVSTQSVGVVTYQTRSLDAFTLDLSAFEAEDLLEAVLELQVEPDAPQGAQFVEVQAAAWEEGAPVLPTGSSGYVSEIAADRGEDATILLDITPILADAIAAEQSQATLVVGPIAANTLEGATVVDWDGPQGIWGVVRIHHR